MSTPAVTPNPGVSPDSYTEYLKAQIAAQANTTGLTQVGPGGTPTPPVQQQRPQPGAQQNQVFGPGQKGAARKQSMQNTVKAAQGVANQFAQYAQAKQQREYEQVVTKFTQATQGLAQAQAQLAQGRQTMQAAQEKLKANPQDTEAQQQFQQGLQMARQAQTAHMTNKTLLDDMANDKKQHKIITKAFGIDDKNADSPERKAAQSALKKQMGVGDQAAALEAGVPQVAQLSPAGQSQQLARQAGVVGAPVSGNAALQAGTKIATTATTEAGKDSRLQTTEAGKDARAQLKDNLTAALNGQKYVDGKLTPMTPEEIQKSPVLLAKIGVEATRMQLQQAQQALTEAKTKALPEQVKMAEAKVSVLQGNLMMRQKEFGVKVAEEERKQLETVSKTGATQMTGDLSQDVQNMTGGRPLQTWAQQTVVLSKDRLGAVDDLMQKLESMTDKDGKPLKDVNQAGYLALDRMGYAMGFASPSGQLGAEISNIELQKVVNAATILKGSSRAYAALSQAMIHTPDAWKDSPQLMYQKLQNIKSNLEQMQTDAIQYGQKGERSGEMTPGTKGPAKADHYTFDPATGTVK